MKTFPPRRWIYELNNHEEQAVANDYNWAPENDAPTVNYISLEEHRHLIRIAKADAFEDAAKGIYKCTEVHIAHGKLMLIATKLREESEGG